MKIDEIPEVPEEDDNKDKVIGKLWSYLSHNQFFVNKISQNDFKKPSFNQYFIDNLRDINKALNEKLKMLNRGLDLAMEKALSKDKDK